jgi:hypothetical protein
MKRALSLIIMVVALVALAGPSLSRGLEGVRIDAGSVVTAADTEGEQTHLWGCKTLGGKRLVPCHPDLGVLAPPPGPMVPSQGPLLRPDADAIGSAMPPETELPPPRLG